MKNWFKNFVRKLCEFNIIMSKTTLRTMDFMEDMEAFDKKFKEKIEK